MKFYATINRSTKYIAESPLGDSAGKEGLFLIKLVTDKNTVATQKLIIE